MCFLRRGCRTVTDRFSIHQILYNADCVSDQAILYWASKGAAPQGKQNFLKVTEPLVKVSVGVAGIVTHSCR